MENDEFSTKQSSEGFWGNLGVQYWYFVVIFGLIALGAVIVGILTLNWYVDTSTIGGQGTWTFDQFSLGTGVEWIIFLILWTLALVILPALVVGGIVIAIIWFGVFSTEERDAVKLQIKRDEEREKRFGRRSEGSGIFGFFMFVGVCIYVALDGNWTTEFGSLSFGYFVDAWIAVFMWAVVFGCIIAGIAMMWFINKYGK